MEHRAVQAGQPKNRYHRHIWPNWHSKSELTIYHAYLNNMDTLCGRADGCCSVTPRNDNAGVQIKAEPGQLPNHGGTPPLVDLSDPDFEALLSIANASENVSNRDSRCVLITHADHHPC